MIDSVAIVSAHRERAVVRVGDVFIKVETNSLRSVSELDALATVTAVPVPKVLWHEDGPPHVMALSRVAGSPLATYGLASPFGEDVWRSVGAAVARLHQTTPATDEQVAAAMRSVAAHADHLASLREWCLDGGHGDPSVVTQLTSEAAAFFRDRTPVVGLLHGDLQPDHVFIDGGEISGVIDWADTGWGDVVADLAVLTIGYPSMLAAVLDGYGGSIDHEAVRAYWILRRFSVIKWRADHDLSITDDVESLPDFL